MKVHPSPPRSSNTKILDMQKNPNQGNQAPSSTPSPPPGFMTITVQVPQTLGPTRTMFVYVNPYYPIQVTIPPGLPPGSFVPVYCPIPPPHPAMTRYYHRDRPPGNPPPK